MHSPKFLLLLTITMVLLVSCREQIGPENRKDDDVTVGKRVNLIADFEPISANGDINAIIEIPAGTIEKWEVDKESGQLFLQQLNGQDRIINYLGYPGNYGMLPRTLLPKAAGGDGDPLDILVLGPPVARGTALSCKLIGVLYLEDTGEQDDKIIAVSKASPLYQIDNLNELENNFKGIKEILQLWFTNYKGQGIMVSKGFGDKEKAMELLSKAISEYQKSREAP